MPLSAEHKEETRQKILDSARILFNRHGFEKVSIDMVMEKAGLTRGGFYNHFKNKEALFSEAISHFLHAKGTEWRKENGVDVNRHVLETVQSMINAYLSAEHLEDLDNQCPMIALPSDVARCSRDVQNSYQRLLSAMVWLFETSLKSDMGDEESRQKALSLASMCIGGMVIARTLPDSQLADELRQATLLEANSLVR